MEGQAFDAGQFASANNLLQSGGLSLGSKINLGLGMVDLTAGIMGNIMKNNAVNKAIDEQISAIKQSVMWNKGIFAQKKTDQTIKDMMSMWASGITSNTGTAMDVITSNQNVFDNELAFYIRQTDTQMKNLSSQKKHGLSKIFG